MSDDGIFGSAIVCGPGGREQIRTERGGEVSEFSAPSPQRPGERHAFLARINESGDIRTFHVTGRRSRPTGALVWEVDVEDWWVFARDYRIVGDAPVDRPKALIEQGQS